MAPYRDYAYATQEGAHRLETITEITGSGTNELEAFPSYDASGNPTTWVHEGDSRTLRWDALDRLVAIEGSSFSASYAYDPLGRWSCPTSADSLMFVVSHLLRTRSGSCSPG